jgi:hypothetical protein
MSGITTGFHALAIALFSMALVFYLIGTAGFEFFTFLGVITEITAWISTLLKSSNNESIEVDNETHE